MAEHQDESLLDKVKNALGMGDDHEHHDDQHDADAQALEGDRADGWAGVPDALNEPVAGTGDAGTAGAGYETGTGGTGYGTDVGSGDTGYGTGTGAGDTPYGSGTGTGDTTFGSGSDAGLAEEPSGLGRNPGPIGSAQYEGGSTPSEFGGSDVDAGGEIDTTREEVAASQFGGAYGQDDTPMPTEAAWDRGEADPLPGDASFGDRTDDSMDEGGTQGPR